MPQVLVKDVDQADELIRERKRTGSASVRRGPGMESTSSLHTLAEATGVGF